MQIARLVSITTLVLLTPLANDASAEPPRLRIEHKSPILSVAFSPDGKWFASGTQDGTIRVFAADTGKEIRNASVNEAVPALAFSTNGSYLVIAAADQSHFFRWNIADSEPSKNRTFIDYNGFRLRPGQFVVARDNIIAIDQGACFEFWPIATDNFHGGMLSQVGNALSAVSPSGSLAGSCDPFGTVHIQFSRDVTGGQPDREIQVGKARCIAMIPSWNYVAVGFDDASLDLWSWQGNVKLGTLTGLHQPAERLISSYDGDTLAALTADKRRIVLWDLTKWKKCGQINHGLGKVGDFAISPDAKTIATATENGKTLYLWNADAIRTVTRIASPLVLTPQQLSTCWNDLAYLEEQKSDDAWHKLGAASDLALPFLRQKIREHAVPTAGKQNISLLVANLDSDKFTTREAATRELVAAGEIAILPLQRLLENPPSLEAATRARLILQALVEPKWTPDRLRVLEAIDLLELMGTAKAVELLEEIEHDALIAQIHCEASEALKRLSSNKKAK